MRSPHDVNARADGADGHAVLGLGEDTEDGSDESATYEGCVAEGPLRRRRRRRREVREEMEEMETEREGGRGGLTVCSEEMESFEWMSSMVV